MATAKHLDNAGEEARKLYSNLVSAGKDYNTKRKARTELIRTTLAPVWEALAKGEVVNGCTSKLEWAKWANPSAKHPERYFYKLMGDTGLKSVQPKKKHVVLLHNGLILSAKGLPGSRSLATTEFEVLRVQKHGVTLKSLDEKQNIYTLEVRVRPLVQGKLELKSVKLRHFYLVNVGMEDGKPVVVKHVSRDKNRFMFQCRAIGTYGIKAADLNAKVLRPATRDEVAEELEWERKSVKPAPKAQATAA